VRMVLDHQGGCPTQWKAIESISAKLWVNHETLRVCPWGETDAATVLGTSDERAKMKDLKVGPQVVKVKSTEVRAGWVGGRCAPKAPLIQPRRSAQNSCSHTTGPASNRRDAPTALSVGGSRRGAPVLRREISRRQTKKRSLPAREGGSCPGWRVPPPADCWAGSTAGRRAPGVPKGCGTGRFGAAQAVIKGQFKRGGGR
jgi:hypothetical protein